MRNLWINAKNIDSDQSPGIAIDPANENTIGDFTRGTLAEAEQAVQSAKTAYPLWRKDTVGERASMLHEVSDRMRGNLEQLAIELTLETGRLINKNQGYVEWSAQCFDYYAELARDYRGRLIATSESSKLSLVLKFPLGVVADYDKEFENSGSTGWL